MRIMDSSGRWGAVTSRKQWLIGTLTKVGTTIGVKVGRKKDIDYFSTDRTEWNPSSETRSATYTGITLLRPSLALDLLWDRGAILSFWFSLQQNVGVGLGCFIIIET